MVPDDRMTNDEALDAIDRWRANRDGLRLVEETSQPLQVMCG